MNLVQENNGLRIELASEADTVRLGRALAALATPGVVIALVGPLGAGKTQLTRAIAEARGVNPDAISSPTFVLIHEYAGDIPIYHADVFRLANPAAFLDLGIVDYFGGDGICVIEWADRVREVIPADAWWIELMLTGPTSRCAQFQPPPERTQLADELAGQLA
jgi:tRNA threonylcarbamoyladenosine biosynthesis protein TsaE